MYNIYDEFLKLLNSEKPVVDFMIATAKRGKTMANCCVTSSCLLSTLFCGLCCTHCMETSVNVGDMFRKWLNILKIYNGIDASKTNAIFSKAMAVLASAKKSIEAHINEKQQTLNITQTCNVQLSLELNHIYFNYSNENWLHTFLENVLMRMNYNCDIPYVTLTEEEISILYAALPMFYMALIRGKTYSRAIYPMERKIIESHIIRFNP